MSRVYKIARRSFSMKYRILQTNMFDSLLFSYQETKIDIFIRYCDKLVLYIVICMISFKANILVSRNHFSSSRTYQNGQLLLFTTLYIIKNLRLRTRLLLITLLSSKYSYLFYHLHMQSFAGTTYKFYVPFNFIHQILSSVISLFKSNAAKKDFDILYILEYILRFIF